MTNWAMRPRLAPSSTCQPPGAIRSEFRRSTPKVPRLTQDSDKYLYLVKGDNLGMGFVTDAVYSGVGSDLELTTAWSVTAGVEHHWNPAWRTSLYGGYEAISYNQNATAENCAGRYGEVLVSSTSAGGFTPANCSPDFSFWQIGSRTVWNPIADLELGLDILYNHINSAFEGPVTVSANGTIPPGLFTARDQNVLSGALRIQRNFVP